MHGGRVVALSASSSSGRLLQLSAGGGVAPGGGAAPGCGSLAFAEFTISELGLASMERERKFYFDACTHGRCIDQTSTAV